MSMTRKSIVALSLGLFFNSMWIGLSVADDVKIGFVDSELIFSQFKEFSDVQQKFDKEVEEWQQRREQLKVEVDSLAAYIKGEISVLPPRLPFHALSEAKQKEKREEYQAKETAYLEYVNTIFGPDGTAERRNVELLQPLLDKANIIIANIAKEEGYTYVLDTRAVAIVYADPKYDITQSVIAEINKEVE